MAISALTPAIAAATGGTTTTATAAPVPGPGVATATGGSVVGGASILPYNLTIAERAASYLKQYDANSDGSISLKLGEGQRTESYSYQDWYSGSTWTSVAVYSIEALAGVADKLGNNDGKTTAAELERAMSRYDTGDAFMPSRKTQNASRRDGVLSGTEANDFYQQLGERYLYGYSYQSGGTKGGETAPVKDPQPLPAPAPTPA